MDYLIVENRQTVHLGPMPWRQRMFQEELNDLEVEFTVPATPQNYIKINDNFEIFPVSLEQPPYLYEFESLSGPTWEYTENTANGTYTVYTLEVPQIKNTLISITASQRYDKENSGTTTNIQNQTVTIDTSREGRAIFVQAYSIMQDGTTIDWKFPETWLTLTKDELKLVVDTGAGYVQTQFNWEKTVTDLINNATTVEELRFIAKEHLGIPKTNDPIDTTLVE